jgi:nucleotide-binding universal stress UspA family protein
MEMNRSSMQEEKMYKHILVPTDGSALSLKAARAAAKLATKLKAKITTLYVMAPYMPRTTSEDFVYHPAYSIRDYEKDVRKAADKALAKVAAATGAAQCDRVAKIHDHPWKAIIDAAKSRKCDLIVMASHGRRGLAGLLLGSETQKVLTHSKTPVLVCR